MKGEAYVKRVAYAQLLHDASEVTLKGLEAWQIEGGHSLGEEDTVTITLPNMKPNVTVPVVELFLNIND